MHDNDWYLMTARYLCHLPMIILQSPNVIHHMGTRMKGIVCRFPMISIYGDGNTAFPQNHRQKYFHPFYFFFCRERLTAGTCRFRPYINNVRAGIAQRCEIQLAYAIGRARPIGLYVDTFGTTSVPEDRIADAIREVFDLRPLGMIEDLDLLRPIYRETAAYGHFGRDQFPWEATNRVEQLKAALA